MVCPVSVVRGAEREALAGSPECIWSCVSWVRASRGDGKGLCWRKGTCPSWPEPLHLGAAQGGSGAWCKGSGTVLRVWARAAPTLQELAARCRCSWTAAAPEQLVYRSCICAVAGWLAAPMAGAVPTPLPQDRQAAVRLRWSPALFPAAGHMPQTSSGAVLGAAAVSLSPRAHMGVLQPNTAGLCLVFLLAWALQSRRQSSRSNSNEMSYKNHSINRRFL